METQGNITAQESYTVKIGKNEAGPSYSFPVSFKSSSMLQENLMGALGLDAHPRLNYSDHIF